MEWTPPYCPHIYFIFLHLDDPPFFVMMSHSFRDVTSMYSFILYYFTLRRGLHINNLFGLIIQASIPEQNAWQIRFE